MPGDNTRMNWCHGWKCFSADGSLIGWRLITPFLIAICASSVCAKGQFDSKKSWSGEVSHVTDGDTLWVRPQAGGRPRKLRLDGIDAPESCQAHGSAAREALAARVLHRRVQVSTRAMDDYRRALATVRLQGEDVGGWMVVQGHAWSYRYRSDPGPYATEEKKARRLTRGLFADARAERPRDFRQRHGACPPSR